MTKNKLIKVVFNNFVNELNRRLNNINLDTSEDTVRMYLYKAMFQQDPCLDHYSLEFPYIDSAGIPNAKLGIGSGILKAPSKTGSHQELDLFYDDGIGNVYAFEIKFHRKKNSASNKTAKAGAIFNDLNRLNIIKGNSITKYFVYVTDDEMKTYLDKKSVRPSWTQYQIQIPLKKQSKTFGAAAWASFNKQSDINIAIKLVSYYDNLNYFIEIYEVK